LTKHAFFNPNAFSMPSAKDIFASDAQFKTKCINVKRLGNSSSEDEPMQDELDTAIYSKDESKTIAKNV
jgi:hypothetical protein